MWSWIPLAIFLADYALRLGLIARVLMRKLNVSTTLAWSFILLFLPLLGVPFYLLIGENRLGSRRGRLHSQVDADLEERALGAWKGGATDWTSESEPFDQVARLCAAVCGLPPLKGNRLALIGDSDEMLESLVRDIDNATHHAHLLYYIWSTQGFGPRKVGEALSRAAARGVECRVLVDAVGSADFLRSPLASSMRADGVQIVAALPVHPFRALFARVDLRNHRKAAVIDGRVAYIGSQNLNDSEFNVRGSGGPGPWIDATVRIEGPAAQAVSVMFIRDWDLDSPVRIGPDTRFLPDIEPREGGVVQLAPSGPSSGPLAIQQSILTTIYSAREEIIITTPYFVPDDPTRLALQAAAMRGVEVTLVLPKKVNSPLVGFAGKSEFGALLDSGVRIRLHRRGLLHSKTMTVDRRFGMIGSVNLDMRSFWLNFEATLFVYDDDFASQLRWLQTGYIEESDELTAQKWRQRPFAEKGIEHVARLFGPLL